MSGKSEHGQTGDQPKPDSRKKAAALSYDPRKEGAPRVLAAGRGTIAEKIIEAARLHGVPVVEDSPLAEGLIRVEIGREIPPELFQAVAQVMAFLYRLERDGPARRSARSDRS